MVPDWLNKELYPFDSHFLDIDGNRIHYVDEGSGPTLLLVHGNPVWSFVYSNAIKALRSSFRCLAVDLAGFGLSEAAPGFSYLPAAQSTLLAALIEQLDLRNFSVVVHDWGGPIGLSAALVAPERLSGVVISNTWAWPVNGNPGFEKFSGLMGGPLGRLGSTYFNAFVNVLVPLSHKRRRLSHAEMTQYRKPLPFGHRRPTWVLPKQIIGSREFLAALESRLSELSTRRALIVWGDKDDAFAAPELARWQQILPSARTVLLKGVGHFAASEAPVEFVAAVREWHAS
ncbi:MAG TPA: alpha/beta fold hydrolase [Acidimicrobiales bacterium]|nr:alpha/beta fold hydrolase [Acidimicrobiales bacterium]